MKIKDKITSIYHGWKNYLISNEELEPLFKDRLDICGTCSRNKAGICTLCGCVLQAKTRSLEEQCPINKWNPVLRSEGLTGNLFRFRSELPNNIQKYFDNETISEEDWQEFIKENEG